MSQDFKTQEEVIRYVLGGGAVRSIGGDVVKLIDGFIKDKDGCVWGLSSPEHWSKHIEPLKLEFEAKVTTCKAIASDLEIVLDVPNKHELKGKRFKCVLTEIVGE